MPFSSPELQRRNMFKNKLSHQSFRAHLKIGATLLAALTLAFAVPVFADDDGDDNGNLDAQVRAALRNAHFTGKIESTLETRLGRKVNPQLADLGRLLFFDVSGGLHLDNTCA